MIYMLTDPEWKIMEYLWENTPVSGRRVASQMETETGWKRTTTLTYLQRMENKGIIRCDCTSDKKMYSPVLTREQATLDESTAFIQRIYNGSVSLMVNFLAQKQKLSKNEIKQLYEILERAEKENDN